MPLLTIKLEGAASLGALYARQARFVELFLPISAREMFAAVKADIREEIRTQRSLHDNRAWPKTKAFGNLAAGRAALQSYGSKWSAAPVEFGASGGGAEFTGGGNVASISIRAPGASVHVGGRGLGRNQVVTAIKAKGSPRRMQGAIFAKTGGRVSRRTLTGKGLQVPSRPHANPDNHLTANKVEAVMLRKFRAV